MATKSVWRPVMYGGLAGVVLGALSLIGWTSPYPGICALQFATIVGCGIGGGLVVAYVPIRSLQWLFGAIMFLVAVLGVAMSGIVF
jgi:hypothetical protein